MHEFINEHDLKSYILKNFQEFYSFNFVKSEFKLNTQKRIDILGEDNENIYIVEIKKDYPTQSALKQLLNYMNEFTNNTNKFVKGIIATPLENPDIDNFLKGYPNIKYHKLNNVYIRPTFTRPVILTKELDKKINDDANNNHRSISGQIAYILEQYYKDK